MTQTESISSRPATAASDNGRFSPPRTALSRTTSRMWAAISTHGAVDFFAFLIVPLMSVLEGRVHMSHAQGALIIASGSVASGVIQPIVALLSDRFDTRWLGTLGFFIAVCALGLLGSAETFGQLLFIQVIASIGLGAFHPVCAAAVGQLAGPRRSLAVAYFYCAGMLGGMLGNITAPGYVSFFGRLSAGPEADAATVIVRGLIALRWLIIPGLASVALLAWAIHSAPHKHHGAAIEHAQLEPAERHARWRAIGILYAANVLRFMTDICLIQLIIRWTEQTVLTRSGALELTAALRTEAIHVNGPMQAAKQLGMGVGGVVLGYMFTHKHEKGILFWVPLLGALFIVLMPFAPGDSWLALGLCAIAGIGYAGVIPITISLAQRLLPHRTGLASGLMMGGAWALSSVGPPLIQALYSRVGLRWSFAAVACLLVIASFLALGLRGQLIERVSKR